jgi:hypothetical protein
MICAVGCQRVKRPQVRWITIKTTAQALGAACVAAEDRSRDSVHHFEIPIEWAGRQAQVWWSRFEKDSDGQIALSLSAWGDYALSAYFRCFSISSLDRACRFAAVMIRSGPMLRSIERPAYPVVAFARSLELPSHI